MLEITADERSVESLVPVLPIRKDNVRQRLPETPSHPGGISEAARAKLDERRRVRDQAPGAVAGDTRRIGEQRQGLGEFQGRLNKGYNRENERGNGRMGPPPVPQVGPGKGRSWNDAPTPRTERGRIEDGSMRVPNRGWDETPRDGRTKGGPSNGRAMNRSWDTATPRVNRGPSPDDGEDVQVDAREWEEEQVRLDRDWYSTYDEGNVAGDEDHNPFAGFEDFGVEKEKEMEAKAVKKITARQAQYVSAD